MIPSENQTTTIPVRIWDDGAPGTVMALADDGLLGVEDHEAVSGASSVIVDPADPATLEGDAALVGHRRLAELVHRCFGAESEIIHSPRAFKEAFLTRYGSRLKNCDLLDVGCGSLEALGFWDLHVRSVRGLDVFECEAGHDGRYSQLPLSGRFPIDSNSFDFVVSLFVLEHVLDLKQSIREVSRVLRLGGIAVWITTLVPSSAKVQERPRLVLTHWRDFTCSNESGVPWLVSLGHLRQLLDEAQLTVESMDGTLYRDGDTGLEWIPLRPDCVTTCQQVLIEVRCMG